MRAGGGALAPEMALEEVEMTLVERAGEWSKQLIREGREQGIEQGLAHERPLLRRQAASRFGTDTAEWLGTVLASIADPERLAEVGEWLVRCETGDAFLARITGREPRPTGATTEDQVRRSPVPSGKASAEPRAALSEELHHVAGCASAGLRPVAGTMPAHPGNDRTGTIVVVAGALSGWGDPHGELNASRLASASRQISPFVVSNASYSARDRGQSTRARNCAVRSLHCLAMRLNRLSGMSAPPLPCDVFVRTGVFLPACV